MYRKFEPKIPGVPKIRDNNGTIPGECRKSATIMVPFQRIIKISLPEKNSTIPDECEILETKMVLFQRMMKIATKNGTISENDRNLLAKKVPSERI